MMRIILSLVVCLVFVPVSEAISVPLGTKAPQFNLRTTEGKMVSLGKYLDTVVVLIFWRTEQERSEMALRDARDLLTSFKSRDITILGIVEDSDNLEKAQDELKSNSISFPQIVDRDRQVYGDYGVRVFPTTVIIDRKGAIAYDIPSHPLTYKTKLRGYVRRALGEIDESELEKELSPRNERLDRKTSEAKRLYKLALKFTETRMYDMAINTALQSIKTNPNDAESHTLLGFLYLETEEKDKALDAFNSALRIDAKSNDAKTGLGGALVMNGELDKAIELLESAAKANPYPQMTYYELGKAYELKGDSDTSRAMYKKAIEKIIHKKVLPSSVSQCK